METIRSYGGIENDVKTKVTITNLENNNTIVLNNRFIHHFQFDYFLNVYVIKGYYPNDSDDYNGFFKDMNLGGWIRKVNLKLIHANQVVRELIFNASVLSYKEEIVGLEHYFYVILRDSDKKMSYNNLILPQSNNILYLTINHYKENILFNWVLSKLADRFNFSGELKGNYEVLKNVSTRRLRKTNGIIGEDYWKFQLWVSAINRRMEKVSFQINVYLNPKGYDGLCDYSPPLNILKKLIGKITEYIAVRSFDKERINELKKNTVLSLLSDFKEKIRDLVKREEIIFKPNFNSITVHKNTIGIGSTGSSRLKTKQKPFFKQKRNFYNSSVVNEEENVKELRKEDNNVIGISYNYQDGEAVQEAKYIVQDLNGNILKEGKLDKEGNATVKDLPEGEVEVILGEDNREYKLDIRPEVNPYYNPNVNLEQIISNAEKVDESPWYDKVYNKTLSGLKEAVNKAKSVGKWTGGVLLGDFENDPTTGQIITRTLITMLPLVDQVADIEDIVANLLNLCDEKEENNKGAWIALILTAVGLIPTLGSACKGVFKIVLKQADNLIRDDVLKLLRKLGKGDPIAFIKKIDWNKITKETIDNLTKIFNKSIDIFKKLKSRIPGIGKFDDLIAKLDDIIKRLESLEKQIDNKVAEVFEEIKGKLDNLFEGNQLVPATAGGKVRVKTVPEPNYSKIDNVADDTSSTIKKTEVEDGNIKARTDESEIERKARKNADELDEIVEISTRYSREQIQHLDDSLASVKKAISSAGKDIDYFNSLMVKHIDKLTEEEMKFMKKVRDAVPAPTENTLMQKVKPMYHKEGMMSGEFADIGGCTSKAGDVKGLKTLDEVYTSLRLDYDDSPFDNANEYLVVRYMTEDADEFVIPYHKKIDNNTIKNTVIMPQTGNGFTAAENGRIIPEYESLNDLPPKDGAELYEVAKQGKESLIAIYSEKQGKFIKAKSKIKGE